MKHWMITALLMVYTALPATASDGPATTLLKKGLDSYALSGATAAIETWIKDSSLEGNTDALAQADILKQVEVYYGKYQGSEIIRDHEISRRCHLILCVMNYAKGPLFVRFQSYRTAPGKWVVTGFNFNTEPDAILPPEMVFGN